MKTLILPFLGLSLATLACSGTLTANTSAPVYVCPTPVVATPLLTPTLPLPPGAPTLIPTATPLPVPAVTAYVIQPPQPFYLGDAVFTRSPIMRLRLLDVNTVSSPTRTVAVWQIELKNLSGESLDLFPAWQSYVSRVSGATDGVWGVSTSAMVEAGFSVPLEAVTLVSGETRMFTLAAFIPYGTTPERITFALDPTIRPTPPPSVPGSNLLVWQTVPNPFCAGDIADPPLGVLPP